MRAFSCGLCLPSEEYKKDLREHVEWFGQCLLNTQLCGYSSGSLTPSTHVNEITCTEENT